MAEAQRIKTVEVEKVKLGANADIVFNGERKYDDKGNVIALGKDPKAAKASKKQDLLKMFETKLEDDDEEDDGDIMSKKGAALFTAADATCTESKIGRASCRERG